MNMSDDLECDTDMSETSDEVPTTNALDIDMDTETFSSGDGEPQLRVTRGTKTFINEQVVTVLVKWIRMPFIF